MTTINKTKVIKEQLEQVQARILENEKLQEGYPKQKRGLLIALATLKHLEKHMIDAIQDEYVSNNHETYEIYLKGKNLKGSSIPIKDLGELLIEEQNTITLFGSKDPLKRNSTIPSQIINNTQVNLVATAGRSFRIILNSPQKVFFDVDNAESDIKHAFSDINELIECGENRDALEAQESKLGSKKINAYKKLLNLLYEKDMNMEISTRTSNKENIPIINIQSKNAKNVYNALIEKEEPSEDIIEITGVLRAFDLTTLIHNFKIVTKIENKEKTIKVHFNNELDDEVINHMNQLSKVILQRVINQRGIGENNFLTHTLINFVDDQND